MKHVLTSQICSVCETSNGYCVQCSTCSILYHVECAHRAGHILGFDLQPIKSSQSRRDSLALVRLGTESGLMTPVIYCSNHDLRRVTIHTLDKIVPDLGGPALSLYNTTYKASSLPLGRRSRKGVAHSSINSTPASIASRHRELHPSEDIEKQIETTDGGDLSHICRTCKVQHSAYFFSLEDPKDLSAEICHRCHWMETQSSIDKSDTPKRHVSPAEMPEKLSEGASIQVAEPGKASLERTNQTENLVQYSASADIDRNVAT